MKIAAYSSYPFHFEMMGFLIHYCKKRNYELVIYCLVENDMGFLKMYRQVFETDTYKLVFKYLKD